MKNVDVVVAPPLTALAAIAQIAEENGGRIEVAAQNFYPKDSGAYTGEVSAPMLLEAGAKWVLIGHSERREFHAETDEVVAGKLAAAFRNGLTPIFCVGEGLDVRKDGRQVEHVLGARGLGNPRDGEGDYRFLATGDTAEFRAQGSRFLQLPVGEVEHVDLRSEVLA